MGGYNVLGSSSVTCSVAAAAMAMVTARTEEKYHMVGFSNKLAPINIHAKMRLDEVCSTISKVGLTNIIWYIHCTYKECAHFARTLLSGWLHACCYDPEMVFRWICAHLNFLPLQGIALEKHVKLQCIQLVINQLVQKLIGLLEAIVETVSLQRKSVSWSSPNAKANRSDLSSSFRLGGQLQAVVCKFKSYSLLLSLRASTKQPVEHIGSLGADPLCDTVSVASSLLRGSEWRPKSVGQATSAELFGGTCTHARTHRQN